MMQIHPLGHALVELDRFCIAVLLLKMSQTAMVQSGKMQLRSCCNISEQ